ncbi:hypothetical protein [Brevundimonas sp.]|uniref:hypothetical protein n=1 Tax=Brevundimonas sp. TaxID=1871086 RepID=UPI002D54B374|nr:hypothetical protein [Brevundimonas sp.]HYD28618.1 hypothetical protein [Brevundimonas sp.]
MKPRRPARQRRRDAFYRAVQCIRLDRIAAGTLEPRFDREHYFLWTLNARGRADYADFIVPGLLFMAEYTAGETEAADDAAATPALPPPGAGAITAS